ncbi:MAG: hypothetical protein QOK10_2761 [Pseudonocardiales bacterium]|jgi:hypothetical protein|nr:hypothetical protein [Pseudonocardiales bacterium]
MASDFDTIIRTPPSGRRTAVLIDHQQYAQAIILQGRPIPWSDPIAYSQFLGQAQGLLRPDATLLDLGAFYQHAIAEDEQLASSMSARSRIGYALKTLLAAEKPALAARELAEVVAHTTRTPLIVQIPSPLLWLAQTHVLSGAGDVTDLDSDHAENAAMYVAHWLRGLSELPISMLLLDERWSGSATLDLVDQQAYLPVTNVTDHYRWTLGRRTSGELSVVGSMVRGTTVPVNYWLEEDAAAPDGEFLLAEIPAEAVPETVLGQLGRLI